MMRQDPGQHTLYELLGVSERASASELTSAYRKLAMQFHPDRNGGSAEYAARFTLVQNAYSVLSKAQSRREYDAVLHSRSGSWKRGPASTSTASKSPPFKRHASPDPVAAALGHLNFILWDIEALVSPIRERNSDAGVERIRPYLLKMLTFIDVWVLDRAGVPDYFFSARALTEPMKRGGEPHLPHAALATGHVPYAGLKDYFYSIRRRADRFLDSARMGDLQAQLPGTEMRLIDCVLEAHNYCVHYLGYAKRILEGEIIDVPPFSHSSPCFER